MALLDVDAASIPISAEDPCGEDLEYDAEFTALETIAKGKPERTIGDSTIPGEPPKWSDVDDAAQALLARTRDFRVGYLLLKAQAHLHGVDGYDRGLAMIHGWLTDFWESVHPRLDEDDGDPTLRVNSLAVLSDKSEGLRLVRAMRLLEIPMLGTLTWRDILIAKGEVNASEDEEAPPSLAEIENIFATFDIDAVTAAHSALSSSLESVRGIESIFLEKVAAGEALALGELERELAQITGFVGGCLAKRGVAVDDGGLADQAAGAASGAPQVPTGVPTSRDDVIRMLEHCCDYYHRYEPSSPVPLLLERAKRLVTMDFLNIMRDLAPDGLPQAELISGQLPEDE